MDQLTGELAALKGQLEEASGGRAVAEARVRELEAEVRTMVDVAAGKDNELERLRGDLEARVRQVRPPHVSFSSGAIFYGCVRNEEKGEGRAP